MERVNRLIAEFFRDKPSTSITKLSGGSTEAINAKVVVEGHSYVVRILDPTVSLEERRKEALATKLAALHSIAPKVYYVAPDYSGMIIEYIEGPTLQREQLDEPGTIESIAKTLYSLHCLQPDFLPKLDILEDTERKYLLCKQKCREEAFPLLDLSMELFRSSERLIRRSNVPVFSHGDLNPTNIFFSHRSIFFIDWGDAALCEPFFDVAIAGVLNAMSEEQMDFLLTAYLQTKPTKAQVTEFFLMQQAVRIGFSLNLLVYLVEDVSLLLSKKESKRLLRVFLREEDALFGNKLRASSEFLYDMAISSLVELVEKNSYILRESTS